MRHGSGSLYISYDGMLEPLGQSQVLGYLEHLSEKRPIHLISFEKRKDWANQELRLPIALRIANAGIVWHPRRYHKRPAAIATAYDIVVGTALAAWLVMRHRLRIVHARSYVPAVMALFVKHMLGVKFLFDMRGFWADERVDAGVWPRDSKLFRLAKSFERRFLRDADYVVSLTEAGVREMKRLGLLVVGGAPVQVIPTCSDLSKFSLVTPAPRPFVLGYVGTTTGWYLFDPVVRSFSHFLARDPDARVLILNRDEHEHIRRRMDAFGVSTERVDIIAANHEEVPGLLSQMRAAIFFITPTFSKIASAPTKLGELLGSGIPCLSNDGVGDMADILLEEGVGIAVDGFDDESLFAGVDRLVALAKTPDIRERCAAAARRHFDLIEGAARYERIYSQLMER